MSQPGLPLDAVRGSIFGLDPYPTLVNKACAIAFTIATGHVFANGNKRTALAALLQMLELNGRALVATQDELVDVFAKGLATTQSARDEFGAWVEKRVSP